MAAIFCSCANSASKAADLSAVLGPLLTAGTVLWPVGVLSGSGGHAKNQREIGSQWHKTPVSEERGQQVLGQDTCGCSTGCFGQPKLLNAAHSILPHSTALRQS
jgi:hypothetical protein